MNAMNRRGFLAMAVGSVALISGARTISAHGGDGTPMAGGMHGAMPGGTPGAMPMGGAAGAFMTITNGGSVDDRLIAVSTDVAQVSEIHEMKNVNGVMMMSPLPDGLAIPAGQSVELKPGGYHVMLIGLKHDLNPGEHYELKVTFEHAGEITLDVPIFATKNTFADADKLEPVMVGDLKIEGVWTRMAPALLDASATPVTLDPSATPAH